MTPWQDDTNQRRRQHLPYWLIVAALSLGLLWWWYQQQSTFNYMAAQLAKSRMEQALSQLHLTWLREQKRQWIDINGEQWRFSATGWPQGSAKREQGQQACIDIWRLLLDEDPKIDGKMLIIEMTLAPTSCSYRNGNGFALSYNTHDGRVSLLQE